METRRLFAVLLALLLALPAWGAAAEEGGDLHTVRCPEMNISTLCDSDYLDQYVEGDGLYLYLKGEAGVPYVLIRIDRGEKRVTDGAAYIRDTITPIIEEEYGNNGAMGIAQHGQYILGNRVVAAVEYTFRLKNGERRYALYVVDVREDCTAIFIAACSDDADREAVLSAADIAAANLRASADAYGPAGDAGSLIAIDCPEEGFSTRGEAGFTSEYVEGDGLYVYIQVEGYIPYVLLSIDTSDTRITDGDYYIRERLMPEFLESWSDNGPIQISQHDDYTLAGRPVSAVECEYRNVKGTRIHLVVIFDVYETYTVYYRIRYVLDEDREETLNAAETIAANLRVDAAPAVSAAPAAKAAPVASLADYDVKASQPIVSRTVLYDDGRFSMQVPEGWVVKTEGYFWAFAYCVVDPENPQRCFYCIFRMENFLKSEAAREYWRALYPTSMFSSYSVLDTSDVVGLLGKYEEVADYNAANAAIYDELASAAVLPDIHLAQVYECSPDRSVARFDFLSHEGYPGEGIAFASSGNIPGIIDVEWYPYYMYFFSGITAPIGELAELEPVLEQCMTSLRFTNSYLKTWAELENITIVMLQESTQQCSSDISSSWEERNRSYDIISQKQSDATLGYDRLYDSETGEVYRADVGFYDTYDLHRDEYANSNLQLIDSGSERYYLQGVDYYITK